MGIHKYHKKEILKKYTGEGGPGASYFRRIRRDDDRKIDLTGKKLPSPFRMIGNMFKRGVTKYKAFSKKHRDLDAEARFIKALSGLLF